MNLLPEEIKVRNRKNEKLVKSLKIIPAVLLLSYIPIISLSIMENVKEKELSDINTKIEEIKNDYVVISQIEEDIAKKKHEIELYDMLIAKEPRWGNILTSIDKNIPFKVQLDNLSISYVENSSNENTEDNEVPDQNTDTNTSSDTQEAIYNKVPNLIIMTGKAQTPSLVGQFLYNLKALPYFEDIKLSGVTEQSSSSGINNKATYSFSITAKIKDGVIISE